MNLRHAYDKDVVEATDLSTDDRAGLIAQEVEDVKIPFEVTTKKIDVTCSCFRQRFKPNNTKSLGLLAKCYFCRTNWTYEFL